MRHAIPHGAIHGENIMSHKHFKAMAEQFNSARKLALNETEVNAIRDCAERMAQVCRQFNPAFKTATFMEACGF